MECEELHVDLSGSCFEKYPAKQHAQKAVQHLGVPDGLIYLQGQSNVSLEDSDMTYPFRQRRGFYYLSGVDEPDCHLLYDVSLDYSVLYVPHVTPEKVVWFGRGSTVEEAKEKYDFDDVRWTSEFASDFSRYVHHNPAKSIYILHPSHTPPVNLVTNFSHKYNSTALFPAVKSARVTKTQTELDLICNAINVSSLAHKTVLHHITNLQTEAAVEAVFLSVCMTYRCPRQAYDPIVAAGTNASILHYSKDNDSILGRPLLCLDAGGEYSCYASDITRTFPLTSKGWPNPESKAIYDLVEEMQEACIAALGPGVYYADVNRLAQRIAVRGLIRLQILRIPDDAETIEFFIITGGIHAFFPHGLGHHIGLDVHDAGPIDTTPAAAAAALSNCKHPSGHAQKPPPKNNPYVQPWTRPLPLLAPCTPTSTPLEPGMIITVEPGIYFNKYALDHLYLKYADFRAMVNLDVLERYIAQGGARIEDDILITETGYRNLTNAPKGQEMLDVIREGAKCDHGVNCPFPQEGGW